jgi:pimeloyl-ACP methyl ester carboxylesterase
VSAVILIDGVGSEEQDGGTFYPVPPTRRRGSDPVVRNYCPLDPRGHEQDFPSGLKLELRRWSEYKVPGGSSGGSSSSPDHSDACQLSGGFATDSCLTARLADAGAVLLPYSYKGAELKSDGRFTFNGYSSDDSKQRTSDSVNALDAEIRSIRKHWRTTSITIVGHSYGGLLAEAWWAKKRSVAADRFGVTQAFALDSPINGVENCKLVHFGVGDEVSAEFCRRWNDRDRLDQSIIQANTDHSLTVVGTPHDGTYDFPAAGGLADQLVYSCSGGDESCVATPPSFLSNSAACDGSSGELYGTKHHDLVKACPDVVRRIVASARRGLCSGLTYRAKQPSDQCGPAGVAQFSPDEGLTYSASALFPDMTATNGPILCASVRITNSSEQSTVIAPAQFLLQRGGTSATPTDELAPIAARLDMLRYNTTLDPGSSATGSVCFSKPGWGGLTLLGYGDENKSAGRLIWINDLGSNAPTPVPQTGGAGRSYAVTDDLLIRSGPATTYPSAVTVPRGTQVIVQCTMAGETVDGPYGPDSHWDRVTYNGVTGFAADEYIDTKQDITNPALIPPC